MKAVAVLFLQKKQLKPAFLVKTVRMGLAFVGVFLMLRLSKSL